MRSLLDSDLASLFCKHPQLGWNRKPTDRKSCTKANYQPFFSWQEAEWFCISDLYNGVGSDYFPENWFTTDPGKYQKDRQLCLKSSWRWMNPPGCWPSILLWVSTQTKANTRSCTDSLIPGGEPFPPYTQKAQLQENGGIMGGGDFFLGMAAGRKMHLSIACSLGLAAKYWKNTPQFLLIDAAYLLWNIESHAHPSQPVKLHPKICSGEHFFLTTRKPFDAFHWQEFLLRPPLPCKNIYKRQSYMDLFFFGCNFIFLTKTRISQMLWNTRSFVLRAAA